MICSHCNSTISGGGKFCPECGKPLLASAPAQAERRQLTVMFCDVVNSTALSAALDPEELRDLMRHYQESCAKVIRRFEGQIAKYLGDGLLVQFGYPAAHEDDAQRAIRSGLGMLESLKFSDFHTSSGVHVPIDIRIGIHTGLVLIDQIGAEGDRMTDIVGETPNIAARLQGLAEPNSLLISESTAALVGGFFDLESIGPQTLKGVANPVEVFRVRFESAARTRFEATRKTALTELVGRVHEMERLTAFWEDVRKGHGHSVLLTGEAGIGKSRITLALKELAASGADAWLVETQCSPYYQNSAYYPIVSLFEHTILQFTATDDAASRLAKLEGYFAQNGLDLEENVPLLMPLLSLPPHPKYRPLDPLSSLTKQRTMDLLIRLLLQRAERQPVLFIQEDLHWADPSTIELIGHILSKVPDAKILAILTARPEFESPWAEIETIALERLRQQDTRAMVEQILHNKSLPAGIAEQVLSRTDGVPLFVEELLKTIMESGSLVERDDRYDLTGKLENVSVPATLKDSLMARLDRLDSAKAVAQIASVLGRDFSYPLLEAIVPHDKSALVAELAKLVSAELVFQRGEARNATFTFKHALIQDAAYDSLLKTDRQKYHLATAAALRDRFPDIYTQQPELVAQHYTAARTFEAAIPEWLRAGKQADARSANQEAGIHYRKGMELLNALPADSPVRGYELPFQLSYGMSILMVRGYSVPEVAEAITRARELTKYIGDAAELPMIVWALWAYYVTRGDLNVSFKFAEEFLEVASRRNDETLLLEANSMFTLEHLLAGDLFEAQRYMRQCIEQYSIEKHRGLAYHFTQDPLVVSCILGSWNEYFLGYPDSARQVCEMVVAHARTLGHNFSLNYGIAFAAWLYYFMEMPEETERYANEAIAIAQANGYALWIGDALLLLGWAQGQRGNLDQALPLVDQGLGIFAAIGRGAGLPGNFDLKIDILIRRGDFDAARTLLDERWALSDRTNQHFLDANTFRLEAELVLAKHRASSSGPVPLELADQFYRKSIDDAMGRGGRSLAMKSMMGLIELWRGTSREADARAELAALYDTVTEGFDVPVYRRVKKMLEETAEEAVVERQS